MEVGVLAGDRGEMGVLEEPEGVYLGEAGRKRGEAEGELLERRVTSWGDETASQEG